MTEQDATQPYEPPTPDAAPAAPPPPPSGLDVPVAPIASARKGAGPVRWVVALLVVALVVAGGLGAALLLTGSSSGASALAGYAPADSIAYGEGRLDLPGSQRAEVAKTLAAFPGFADQAALDTKLGEVFDRIVRAASNGKHDYQTEIAPWFGGQLAYASGPTDPLAALAGLDGASPAPTTSPTAGLPACTGGETPSPAAASDDTGDGPLYGGRVSVRLLVLASVKDPAKASAWVSSILTEHSAATVDRTCDGVTVHVATDTSRFGPEVGWAVLDNKALVAGDLDSIRLAIATKGTTGLAATPNFAKAVASLNGDHLGFVYQAIRATFDAQVQAMERFDTEGTATAAYKLVSAKLPEWIAADLRASDGNFVANTVEPAPAGSTATNRASELAGFAPAGTIALVDIHDVGKSLTDLHAAVAAEPKFKTYVDQLDRILGLIGGVDSAVGWIGDAGLALTRNGTSVSGGIVIRPQDSSAAKHLFTQIRSLADLSGMATGIKITDEDYKGTTLTTVDLSSLASSSGSGMESMLGGMSIPSDLKVVYAVTDKVIVLSIDPAFAKAVIDASQGGDSLAKDPRFSSLLTKAGDKGTGVIWVDVAAARELIENQLPADARAKYESDYKPYLLPFDALISTGAIDNGLVRGTTILSIKH